MTWESVRIDYYIWLNVPNTGRLGVQCSDNPDMANHEEPC